MALDLSTARKDLSADSLFQLLRSRFASLPDPRAGVVEIPLGDALMSAGLDHRFGHFVWASDHQIEAKPYGIGPSFIRTAVYWPKRRSRPIFNDRTMS
jgi:hypothetical protein